MFGEIEYLPQNCYAAVPLEEQLEALAHAQSAGLIRHYGLSNETPWGLMEACRLGERVRPCERAHHGIHIFPALLLMWLCMQQRRGRSCPSLWPCRTRTGMPPLLQCCARCGSASTYSATHTLP